MRGRSSKVYYYSCQVSKEPCTCRSGFGADAHHSVISTCSALWNSGHEFKQRFDAILRENYESFGGRDIVPVWFEKTRECHEIFCRVCVYAGVCMPRWFYFGLALQLLINLAFVLDELCISSSHEVELAMCIRCFEHIMLTNANL